MNPDDSSQATRELLIEEYKSLTECFWKNEETGDTRVNLYIGLVTAVAGALVVMHGKESLVPEALRRPVLLGGLGALLLFGVITLMRIITRNETTDCYKRGLDHVRQTIRDHFDNQCVLLHYYAFAHPKRKRRQSPLQRLLGEFAPRKFGGLAHTMVAINSVLVTGLVAAWTAPTNFDGGTFGSLGLPFAAAFLLQMLYLAYRESKAAAGYRTDAVTHAGGIVYRTDAGGVRYLIVQPKPNPPGVTPVALAPWIFPKGHVEDREGHAEAALREVREESGVVAHACGLIGRMEFAGKDNKPTVAKLYLMEWLYDVPVAAEEQRPTHWLPFVEALQKLGHPESRHLLQIAEGLRRKAALECPTATCPKTE